MSGMKPFFLTGANAKIRINKRTMAFCTNLSYSVKVLHQNPKILGMYEGHSIEPMGYEVGGTFTIIKYTRGMSQENNFLRGAKAPDGVENSGNGIGTWGPDSYAQSTFGSITADGQAQQGMNPISFNNSVMFDIEVYQKGADDLEVATARLRNCRITQMDFSLNKQGAATQTYQFMAVYADDDSNIADASGIGQNLR